MPPHEKTDLTVSRYQDAAYTYSQDIPFDYLDKRRRPYRPIFYKNLLIDGDTAGSLYALISALQ